MGLYQYVTLPKSGDKIASIPEPDSDHILNTHPSKVYVIYVPWEIRDGVFNMETL